MFSVFFICSTLCLFFSIFCSCHSTGTTDPDFDSSKAKVLEHLCPSIIECFSYFAHFRCRCRFLRMSQLLCSVTKEEFLHVHVCMILHMWRPAGRKTRVETLTNDNCVSREIIANFLNRGFLTRTVFKQRHWSAQMWRRLRNVHVLLHVRAHGDCPVSLAMTHMRWLSGQSGHQSTKSLGCEPGPSTGARTRTRAEVNVRPRPLVCKQTG